ncbi:PREDICTED: cannabinoid receptor 1-like [Priapulus caudatus]|uniref:Cannabinoid receptor 1-like n=1 Tax=Priapulus caudatus TaxID=37621 RepID=A0ABM1F104_PRICU|nr:PREDICTED: cannabinoid receptor 1-like [Priapulus caudatus]
MATANGSLCNISGSVSENGSLVGCIESDIEQGTVKAIQAWIAYLLIPVNLISILANLLVILAVTRTSHLQELAHKLIANLAVADFIMGVRGVFIVPMTFLIEFPPKIICLGHFSVVLISVAMVFIYAYMMMITKHHQRQIHQEPSSSGSQEAVATRKSFSAELAKHLKLAKTFGIVVGAFFVCWAPYSILMLLSVADVYHDTLGVATAFGCMMADSDSFMNFFIYASESSQFRTAFRAVLPSCEH